MGYEVSWQCGECKAKSPSIKMFRKLRLEWATEFGLWIYRHSHCANEYSKDAAIFRRTESDVEWLGSPDTWEQIESEYK
jgi:hypothetical protein